MSMFLSQMFDVLKNLEYENGDVKLQNFDEIVNDIKVVIEEASHIVFIGNGGSAAIAVHMTADFMKNGGKKTISMYDPAILTCLGNDFGYEFVFSKQIERVLEKGDLLVAISSSGNSMNIVRAIDMAHEKGAKVVALTGFEESSICKSKADYSLYVPSNEYGIVESVHNMFLQEVVDQIKHSKSNDV